MNAATYKMAAVERMIDMGRMIGLRSRARKRAAHDRIATDDQMRVRTSAMVNWTEA
ncbi:MAG TPA: hypothetical protein VF449_12795 [Parvibaculum sp.]